MGLVFSVSVTESNGSLDVLAMRQHEINYACNNFFPSGKNNQVVGSAHSREAQAGVLGAADELILMLIRLRPSKRA